MYTCNNVYMYMYTYVYIATANRMKLFWTKANTSVKWKIQVFNAIIRLYGLECIQLTTSELSFGCFPK